MAGKGAPAPRVPQPKERLDKWLFQARFFRSRSVAAGVVEGGYCRVNGQRTVKPGHGIGAGDVLTFPQADRIRLVRVLDVAQRRGPAREAAMLYLDLDAASTALE